MDFIPDSSLKPLYGPRDPRDLLSGALPRRVRVARPTVKGRMGAFP
jgi:hypothetical protein